MTNAFFYSNTAVAGTIGNVGGISNSATSMFLTSTPTGYPGSFPFKLTLDIGTASEEVVKVTAGSGTSGSPWTIVRAWDGTTAVAHVQGASVTHGATAEDFTLSRTHEASGNASGVHGLPASAWNSPNFAMITETTVGSAVPAITFSSIPATYTNLLVTLTGRTDETTHLSTDIVLTFNGDTGAHYSYQHIYGYNVTGGVNTGPAVAAAGSQTGARSFVLAASGGGAAANAGSGFLIIPAYTSTTFNKCFNCLTSFGNGGGTLRWEMLFRSGQWNPTSQAAITSLTLTCGGGNFKTGTFAGLYGFGG